MRHDQLKTLLDHKAAVAEAYSEYLVYKQLHEEYSCELVQQVLSDNGGVDERRAWVIGDQVVIMSSRAMKRDDPFMVAELQEFDGEL